jgi:hypothetical protein
MQDLRPVHIELLYARLDSLELGPLRPRRFPGGNEQIKSAAALGEYTRTIPCRYHGLRCRSFELDYGRGAAAAAAAAAAAGSSRLHDGSWWLDDHALMRREGLQPAPTAALYHAAHAWLLVVDADAQVACADGYFIALKYGCAALGAVVVAVCVHHVACPERPHVVHLLPVDSGEGRRGLVQSRQQAVVHTGLDGQLIGVAHQPDAVASADASHSTNGVATLAGVPAAGAIGAGAGAATCAATTAASAACSAARADPAGGSAAARRAAVATMSAWTEAGNWAMAR